MLSLYYHNIFLKIEKNVSYHKKEFDKEISAL